MSNNSICTAVCVHSVQSPLDQKNKMVELCEKPLLEILLDAECQELILDAASHQQVDPSKNTEAYDETISALMFRFRLAGLLLGSVVQFLNVRGTVYMYMRWGDHPVGTSSHDLSYWAVFIVTQADLYLYVTMWICLTSILTRPGMKYAQNRFFSACTPKPSPRSLFIMGVNLYVGVVIGVFLAWASLDYFWGFPVPLLPMVGVLVFGLTISYAMIWVFDMEEGDFEEDEEESVLVVLVD